MHLMKTQIFVVYVGTLLLLCGCQPQTSICQSVDGTIKYLSSPPADINSIETPDATAIQTRIEIGGKLTQVDRIIEGPLCNDHWSGVVYVSCDIQVVHWEDTPLFLKDCDLSIESDAVVYVAHHNNAAYYNGCSCHSGELP